MNIAPADRAKGKAKADLTLQLWNDRVRDAVTCPRCGVPPGEYCQGRAGQDMLTPHPRRRALYLSTHAAARTNLPRTAKVESHRQIDLRAKAKRSRDAARDSHACPQCKAKAGLYCVSPSGEFLVTIHGARWHSAGANLGRAKRLAPDARPDLSQNRTPSAANPAVSKAVG